MRQAVTLDPNLGQAYAYLAFVDFFDVILSRTDDRQETLQQGMANARKAITIDQRDYIAHWAMGRLHTAEGDLRSAISELETSISINPNYANGYFGLSVAHAFAGNPEKTLELADMAIRLSPNDPQMWNFLAYKGIAYGILLKFEKAIEYFEEVCRFPTAQFLPFTMRAALYAVAGRQEDAEKSLDQARDLEPNLSLQHMREYLGTADQKSFEVFFEGFRKAGLLE